MKRLISRLISWLQAHGFSAADIVDYIDPVEINSIITYWNPKARRR